MSGERSGPMHFFRQALMDLLMETYPRGGKVLDAGCGDGSLSVRLAKKGLSVYGVDCAEHWCDSARKRVSTLHRGEKIEIICSSLEAVDFSPGFFDTIVCGEVLEHLHNDREIINKFHRLLKKGGTLLISVPLAAKGFDASDVMVGHVRLYEYPALRGMLSDIGFRVEKVLGWGYPFAKMYHRFIFLKWAQKFKTENEIRDPTHVVTSLGKSHLVSVFAGMLFFIDIVFTPAHKGTGIVLRARKL